MSNLQTTKIVRGWGLRQPNGWLRQYRSNDSTGFMAGQIAMWPTRKLAHEMALPNETVIKVRAMYISEDR